MEMEQEDQWDKACMEGAADHSLEEVATNVLEGVEP